MTDVVHDIETPTEGESSEIRPFKVSFSDAELADLRRRIKATRWPEAARPTAVCTAVVDLPVPPFSLAKMMKCGWPMILTVPAAPV